MKKDLHISNIIPFFALAKTIRRYLRNILVPWMSGLVSGLQNRVRRFESARNLFIIEFHDYPVPWMSGLVSGLQNHVRRFESARNLTEQKGVKVFLILLFFIPIFACHQLLKKKLCRSTALFNVVCEIYFCG